MHILHNEGTKRQLGQVVQLLADHFDDLVKLGLTLHEQLNQH
jgi:hypothetical protein